MDRNTKIIELRNVSKSFDGETVLKNLSLDIHDKEFITLLGPSGCGKTTTLRIIGGLVEPDEGDVCFMGARINDLPPYKRNVNTVFQRYALFPHLNVFENIAFGLRVHRTPEREIVERVEKMIALVNLKGFEKRNVTTLSGGQQQRVAIARACKQSEGSPSGRTTRRTRLKAQKGYAEGAEKYPAADGDNVYLRHA